MKTYGSNRVIVLGDIILDTYINGSVSRVSPEAPVPIIKITDGHSVLGGASNVANNLAALGCKVSIIGTIGNDEAGSKVTSLLTANNIEVGSINYSDSYQTIEKKRVVANNQQITRLDYNDDARPSSKDILNMIRNFENIIDQYDVVVISDYNKGVCTEELCKKIITLCKEKNKAIIVDPKGENWEKYRGATIITPNVKEVSQLMKTELKNSGTEIKEKSKGICAKLGIQYLLLTRSEKGMTLIDVEDKFRHIPSQAKEVYDVSGAGDTVVATLACFLGNTEDLLEVVNLANIAAGIVVSKFGTSVVTMEEINEILMNEKGNHIIDKIMSLNKLLNQVNKWREKGDSIVFTNGCYDIFHKGHVHSIYSAAEFGDHLIVAINADSSVKRIKGNDRPINNQYDRAYVMAAMGCVDAVIIFDEDTPEKILSMIRPTVLVKGADYKIDEVVGKEFAERVELINYIDGYSTTRTIKKLSLVN